MSSKTNKKQAVEKKQEVQKENKSSNIFLWILAVLFVITAAVGNTYFSSELNIIVRIIGVAILIVLAFISAGFTSQGKKAVGFLRDSRIELRRITWPVRQEATQTTLVVIAITIVTALVLWGLDSIIVAAISFLTSLRF